MDIFGFTIQSGLNFDLVSDTPQFALFAEPVSGEVNVQPRSEVCSMMFTLSISLLQPTRGDLSFI
jgi:hypothetical protein